MQEKGEILAVQNRLKEERQKLAEVAKEARQLEAGALAAKAEAETAALQCLDQSSRAAALLADQQRMQDVLKGMRTAAQAQVCFTGQNCGCFCGCHSVLWTLELGVHNYAEEPFCKMIWM